MIGINDLNSGRTPGQMEEGYRELLRRIRERLPAVRLHVQSLFPTRGTFAIRNEPVRDFNRRLAKLAGEARASFLDLYPLFTDDNGELKAAFTADGLHLNEAGYQVWRREVHRVMA